MDNVKIHEPLGNSDHKQIHFDINVKSEEAIRRIMFKQTKWRVYRRTRNDEDYANYKEALNLATTEIRKYKRTFE